MSNHSTRRDFFKQTASISMVAAAGLGLSTVSAYGQVPARRRGGPKLKTSLNAYSFSDALTATGGKPASMTLFDLLDFCADQNFDAIDPTGYFFPGYPKVPTDAYIASFKRRAFELGLGISGTGIRNNFATADKTVRATGVQLAKDWIEVAAKLGAPVIRVFAGAEDKGADRKEVAKWMADDLRTCVEHGKKHGVVVGVQNHGDFLRNAEQTIDMVKRVNSEWLGVILDTGNYPADPYNDIAAVMPYTVNFQIKESPSGKDSPVRLDLNRFVKIVRDAGYRGYLPIETLPVTGVKYEPFKVVPRFHAEVSAAFARA